MQNKILTITLLLLLSTISLNAQKGYAWKKLGNGINGGTGCSFAGGGRPIKFINSNLYVTEINQQTFQVTIHKWDGIQWSKYPSFGKVGINYYINDIEIYRNELYVCGEIPSIDGLSRQNGKPLEIIKFNGIKWDTLTSYFNHKQFGGTTPIFYQLKVYKHKLYYIQNDQSISSSFLISIDSFSNTKLEIKLKGSSTKTNHIFCLEEVKNKLVLAGQIDSIGNGNSTSGLLFYDGTNMTYTKNKNKRNITQLCPRNDSQYVISQLGSNEIELWQGDSLLKDITHPTVPWHLNSGFTFYKNYIFLTTYTESFYYDMDLSKWFKADLNSALGTNRAIPNRKGKAFIYNCESTYGGVAELEIGSLVSGKIYVDKDLSCTFNTGDIVLKDVIIEFDNGIQKFYTNSDNNGNYEISVLAGNYKVNYSMPGVLSSIAPCSTININVVAGTNISNIGIPVHPSSNKNLGVSISAYRGFRTRLGFTEQYVLTGANYSLVNDSLVIKLKYPSQATYVSSDIVPFSNSSNELIYKFANVGWLEKKSINIEFKTTVGVSSLGDKLTFCASILNENGDSYKINNIDTLEQKIVGAYDPNIKECFPDGRISKKLEKIKYNIHFQNTGNDTAYKVTVVDTFTQKLGLRYLKVTNTSHPNSYSLRLSKSTLIWEFNNILLPDSHTNEKASHGFISFEATINGSIAIGDSITNKAYIYFDYQTPIITNYAKVILNNNNTNIKENLIRYDELIKIYPNPSSSFTSVVVDEKYANYSIELYNVNGQLISSNTISALGESIINVSTLASGIYFVKIEGTNLSSKLIVE